METTAKNSLLIVDDDNFNLTQLSNILKQEYSVRAVSSGAAGVKAAEKFVPDLILLDIMMPEMDGYEVLAALNKNAATANIPVIFITGLDNKSDEKLGLQLGAVDYISKPFDDVIVKLRVHQQIRNINQIRTIEHLSMIDQLTGVPNRRNFDNRLETEWGRAIREHWFVSLLMIDIDHFKTYNDTYGHQQGDKTLIAVARGISGALKRSSDFCARWGGEEFAVLLPNTDSAGSMLIAEHIRADVAELIVPCDNGNVTKMTVSIGANTVAPTKDSSVDEFIKKTDAALYESKNTGRNRVCRYVMT